MKAIHQTILVIALSVLSVSFASAAENKQAGPKGGRLLSVEPRAEFFVNKERKVEITFYNADLKPIAPAAQEVKVTAQAPDGRKELNFERKENMLVSTEPLPKGDGYVIIAQIRANKEARPQNFRIVYEEYICGGCKLVEYACTCHD